MANIQISALTAHQAVDAADLLFVGQDVSSTIELRKLDMQDLADWVGQSLFASAVDMASTLTVRSTFLASPASGNAVIRGQVAASSGSDAKLNLRELSGVSWSITMDGSSSGDLVISASDNPGSGADWLTIGAASGLVTVNKGLTVNTTARSSAFLVDDTSGNIGIGSVASGTAGELLRVTYTTAGSDLLTWLRHTDNTAGGSHSALLLDTGGPSGGDPYLWWRVNGAESFAMGIDNSDSDTLKIVNGTSVGSGTVALSIDTDELVTAEAGFAIAPVGSDPGSPTDGQIWVTTAGDLKFRANGTTYTVTAS